MAKPTPLTKLPAAEMLKLDHQLCFALYSSSLAMTKLYKPLLDPLGLTYPQYLAMLVLWEGDAVSVSELGQRLQLDSGTLTPLLKRLEASGWVERERDSADERRVRVHLTPAGRALKLRAAKVPPQVLCATGCSLDEIAALTTRLKALRDEIQSFSQAAAA
jgi:DNA-binding MarR family transcriptional regulator